MSGKPRIQENEISAACAELLSLSRQLVHLGGKLDEIIDSPFIGAEVDLTAAISAGDGSLPIKVSDDFHRILLTARRRVEELKQNKIGDGEGATTLPEARVSFSSYARLFSRYAWETLEGRARADDAPPTSKLDETR